MVRKTVKTLKIIIVTFQLWNKCSPCISLLWLCACISYPGFNNSVLRCEKAIVKQSDVKKFMYEMALR